MANSTAVYFKDVNYADCLELIGTPAIGAQDWVTAGTVADELEQWLDEQGDTGYYLVDVRRAPMGSGAQAWVTISVAEHTRPHGEMENELILEITGMLLEFCKAQGIEQSGF